MQVYEDFPDCCDWHVEQHYTQHATIGHSAGQRIHVVHEVGCEWAIALFKQQDELDSIRAEGDWEDFISEGGMDEA